jgi:hypothetical protein
MRANASTAARVSAAAALQIVCCTPSALVKS